VRERVIERETESERETVCSGVFFDVRGLVLLHASYEPVCACACVCVREKERESVCI